VHKYIVNGAAGAVYEELTSTQSMQCPDFPASVGAVYDRAFLDKNAILFILGFQNESARS
jgi:hypothetical protein